MGRRNQCTAQLLAVEFGRAGRPARAAAKRAQSARSPPSAVGSGPDQQAEVARVLPMLACVDERMQPGRAAARNWPSRPPTIDAQLSIVVRAAEIDAEFGLGAAVGDGFGRRHAGQPASAALAIAGPVSAAAVQIQ